MKFSFAVVCLLFLTTISSSASVDAESNAFMGGFNPCAFCKNATDVLQQGLDFKNMTIEQFGKTLDGLCDNIPEVAQQFCHNFVGRVIGLYAFAYASGTSSLEGFCEGTFQCPSSETLIFTGNGIFETTCNLCKTTLGRLVKVLSAEQVTESSARIIALFCSGPGRILGKDDCAKAAAQYVEMTYGRTVKFLRPESFCRTTGACSKSGKEPEAEAPGGSVEYQAQSKVLIT